MVCENADGFSEMELSVNATVEARVPWIQPHSTLDYRSLAPEVYEPKLLEPVTLTLGVTQ